MIRIWEKTYMENLEQNLANTKKTEIKEPEWQTRCGNIRIQTNLPY